jgi:hypothetical protein
LAVRPHIERLRYEFPLATIHEALWDPFDVVGFMNFSARIESSQRVRPTNENGYYLSAYQGGDFALHCTVSQDSLVNFAEADLEFMPIIRRPTHRA